MSINTLCFNQKIILKYFLFKGVNLSQIIFLNLEAQNLHPHIVFVNALSLDQHFFHHPVINL